MLFIRINSSNSGILRSYGLKIVLQKDSSLFPEPSDPVQRNLKIHQIEYNDPENQFPTNKNDK